MNAKKVLAIIPARGGSKGIVNKNLRLLRGKPLIQHAVDYAKSSSFIDKIVVSTDSDDIGEVALSLGVEVIKRPVSISGDNALVIDAMRHVVSECELQYQFFPDIVILLECTSPIKKTEEINKAIEILTNGMADSVATFKETSISPNRLWKIEENSVFPFIKDANPFLPRQVQPKGYELTGQIYALTTQKLKEDILNVSLLLGKVYPLITTSEVIDIDNEMDLIIAEQVLKYIENK
jgi:CMP-N-acetylneuraminic acid synthetase